MRDLAPALLLALLASPALLAQEPAAQEPAPLSEGELVTDSLPADGSHAYTVDLAAEWYVYGEADQESVDVRVEVKGPDGSRVARFDGPARGPERFHFESEASGAYRIEVVPANEETGRYTLTLLRVEPVATEPAARVDQVMAPYSGEDVPGGVVGVMRGGELVFSRAYGMANLTHGIPFTTGTPTNIGSTSKQFTAFAIALLAERGELSLDDDVRQHIPELPDFGHTVTLRNLLTHTSGYREFLNTLALAGRRIDVGDHIARDELIWIVQRQPELQNEPGAEWNYNNTAFGLLTVVVERVTGQPFPEWMDVNVFGPLGMESTVVRADPRQIVPGSAQGYVPADDVGYREAGDLGGAMGAGGIYTTVADLAEWLENLRSPAVGDEGIIEAMTTPYVLTDGDTTDYGLGLMIDEHRGLRRIRHGGADIAHRSMLAYYPEIDAGVAALSNNATFSSGSIAWKVAEAFFGEAMEPSVPFHRNAGGESDSLTLHRDGDHPAHRLEEEAWAPSEAELEAFTGRYFSEEIRTFYTLEVEDGRLVLKHPRFDDVELEPTGEDEFRGTFPVAEAGFERDESGRVVTLHVSNGRTRGVRFEKAGEGP